MMRRNFKTGNKNSTNISKNLLAFNKIYKSKIYSRSRKYNVSEKNIEFYFIIEIADTLLFLAYSPTFIAQDLEINLQSGFILVDTCIY